MKSVWVSNRVRRLLRIGFAFCLVLVMAAVFNAPAQAHDHGDHGHHDGSGGSSGHGHHGGHGGGGGSVPEIDPNDAASALTLLLGGTLVMAGRYRRR